MQFCLVDMPHIMQRFVFDFKTLSFTSEPLLSTETSCGTWFSQYINDSTKILWLPVVTLWPLMYATYSVRKGYHQWLPRHFRQHLIPNDPTLNQMLGGPIQVKKDLKGSFTRDLANFDFQLSGNQRSGDLNVQGRVSNGEWQLATSLKIPGRKAIPIDFRKR